MLPLTEISEWKKLGSAFNNSEEIPELIQKLSETFDIDLMIEITTEYISHQMSLYEVTFAVFPYLIELIEKAEDHEFKLETFLYTMICTCPSCGESLTLWNENDRLVQYKEDPVFVKDQEQFPVEPATLSKAEYSKTIISEKNYQWLSYYIDKLEVESLRVIINYLFGKTTCGYCRTEFVVFENIE